MTMGTVPNVTYPHFTLQTLLNKQQNGIALHALLNKKGEWRGLAAIAV